MCMDATYGGTSRHTKPHTHPHEKFRRRVVFSWITSQPLSKLEYLLPLLRSVDRPRYIYIINQPRKSLERIINHRSIISLKSKLAHRTYHPSMAMPWELAEYLMAVTWVALGRWVAACVSLADGIACSLRRRRRHWQASSTVVVTTFL